MNKRYLLSFSLLLGGMLAEINQEGEISGLWFEKQAYFPKLDEGLIQVEESELNKTNEGDSKVFLELPQKVKTTMVALVKQLNLYQNGKLKNFDLKLAPKGTKFREMVWDILREVPYGETISYGAIAKEVCKKMKRKTMSAQAIGGAVGHNPIAMLIPCHRVVGSDGSLTGYAGGLDKKEALLKLEE